MLYIKIKNFVKEDGYADYKGLERSLVYPASQIPTSNNEVYFIYNGNVVQHEDIQIISELDYNKMKVQPKNPLVDRVTNLEIAISNILGM